MIDDGCVAESKLILDWISIAISVVMLMISQVKCDNIDNHIWLYEKEWITGRDLLKASIVWDIVIDNICVCIVGCFNYWNEWMFIFAS